MSVLFSATTANINLLAGEISGEGAISRPGGEGSKIHVLSSEPEEHKCFCPATRPVRP